MASGGSEICDGRWGGSDLKVLGEPPSSRSAVSGVSTVRIEAHDSGISESPVLEKRG